MLHCDQCLPVQLEFLRSLLLPTPARRLSVAILLNAGANNDTAWKQQREEMCQFALQPFYQNCSHKMKSLHRGQPDTPPYELNPAPYMWPSPPPGLPEDPGGSIIMKWGMGGCNGSQALRTACWPLTLPVKPAIKDQSPLRFINPSHLLLFLLNPPPDRLINILFGLRTALLGPDHAQRRSLRLLNFSFFP